jgi:hypothetical protein
MAKFYAVRFGRRPGIYNTWAECLLQTSGFSRAMFKSFATQREAADFVAGDTGEVGSDASPLGVVSPSVPIGVQPVHAPAASVQARRDAYLTTCRGPQPTLESCYLVSFDGGARPNPGPAASAGMLWSPVGHRISASRTLLAEHAAFAARATNNQAEYGGMILGLRLAAAAGAKHVLVDGDSLLVVNQVVGVWRVLDETLQVG